MLKCVKGVLLAAGLFSVGLTAPANANVIYNLTFENNAGSVTEGTGVLTLNLANVSDAYGLNTGNVSLFNEVSTTDINGEGSFLITPANLASFYISTSGNPYDLPLGKIYTLTVAETVPPSNNTYPPTNILILDLYTNSWEIHGQYNNTVDSGKLVVAGPSLDTSGAPAETPLPATLPLLAGGVASFALLLRRKRHRKALAA